MGLLNFSTQCICMGTGSLFVYVYLERRCEGSVKENRICDSVNCI